MDGRGGEQLKVASFLQHRQLWPRRETPPAADELQRHVDGGAGWSRPVEGEAKGRAWVEAVGRLGGTREGVVRVCTGGELVV